MSDVSKDATVQHTTVTLFSLLKSTERVRNKIKRTYYKVLLDTGSSATLVTPKIGLLCEKVITVNPNMQWTTTAGVFSTNNKAKIQFHLDEFSKGNSIEWDVLVSTTSLLEYKMIMVQDLLEEIGIILDFSKQIITWDNVEIDMPTVNG